MKLNEACNDYYKREKIGMYFFDNLKLLYKDIYQNKEVTDNPELQNKIKEFMYTQCYLNFSTNTEYIYNECENFFKQNIPFVHN